ncbi:MAG: YceD family protein [Alphaproteobacteria bacterium]
MTDPLFEVDLGSLSSKQREVRFLADDATRAEIAARLGLLAVSRFELTASLHRVGKKGEVAFTGQVDASVTQECVVTLEPVEATPRAELQIRLVPQALHDPDLDAEIDPDDKDFELIDGDRVDLGDLAVQYLALELDPYPRKALSDDDAARLGVGAGDSEPDMQRPNPFAVLQQLKDKA